ncbi:MAG: NAD(P)-dependent oxidoreductase [Candidatus Eisenbacteria bacterium]|uniref:NAD(P)-dependent oxidoreductase n=1 Tax=Eiseniibacteriota bacterium TaxID=2212470 RepID=A0A948W6C1_UNCEI|nr:NAD(P)-dependent oxidoreductase [Candidatus Eisenbacteria bacterium]MBU1951227.1 NAD(P)-dependent oxidoreductase [Candidatus Eisenbacteria bacterium]MBU2691344.1 NAD(P)-dependent oxidoreductase [Candidatus Eisenbacteria bacterium]
MSKTRLTAEELERNFAELNPPLTKDEARAAASRCLFCYDAPCTRACPTGIDVPRFIRQILHNNPLGAAETILRDNALGGSCARVCPTEVLCEGACVDRILRGEPVLIGRLQRFAVDEADRRGINFFEFKPESGKKIAVVGSGPAGLSCAAELRAFGHQVTLFEARDRLGGLNTLGIAPYKIRTSDALAEVERILGTGLEIRKHATIDGAGVTELLSRNDAVFLGVGLGKTADLQLPGENHPDVWEGLDFIFQAHLSPFTDCKVGQVVAVLGGGNTAMDAACKALRLGAERVVIVYRRTSQEMPAYIKEYELAKNDGAVFEWLTTPVEFLSDGGGLRGVKCRRVRLEGTGRKARVVPIEGGEFTIPCDMAVKALGQEPLRGLLKAIDGLKTEGNRIIVNPETYETSVPRLYAGGDCVSGGGEVVHAVQEGKIAARAIHTSL